MPLSDKEIFFERIENGDLVAFGEISAADIIQNSLCENDFVDIDPIANITRDKSNSSDQYFKLPLFTANKTQ